MDFASIRQEYQSKPFHEATAASSPFDQFEIWFQEALNANVLEPNAMVLATATPQGRPSSRVVLLKELTDSGLVFYTNYNSRKSMELSLNPQVAVTFFWKELERQIQVEGFAFRISSQESAAYFASRPRGSQLGSWASQQGAIVTDRETLEKQYAAIEKQFSGEEVPLPPFWGGFRLMPTRFEFWQGRANRLHDRLVYQRNKYHWDLSRLSP
jgi:pyridoxamine 5'-phosphate oxidase